MIIQIKTKDKKWKQVTNNLTSIAMLLWTIEKLEVGEKVTIKRIDEKEIRTIRKDYTSNEI